MLVFPRSSSLAGSCWLTGSTQEICWEEGNSCRKATTAPCVRMVWKRLQNIFSFSAPLLSADGLHWGSPGTSILTSTKSFTLQKMSSGNLSLWTFFWLVHGVYGTKGMTTFSKTNRQVLQPGRLLSKILSQITSLESSNVTIVRSCSGLMPCNLLFLVSAPYS